MPQQLYPQGTLIKTHEIGKVMGHKAVLDMMAKRHISSLTRSQTLVVQHVSK